MCVHFSLPVSVHYVCLFALCTKKLHLGERGEGVQWNKLLSYASPTINAYDSTLEHTSLTEWAQCFRRFRNISQCSNVTRDLYLDTNWRISQIFATRTISVFMHLSCHFKISIRMETYQPIFCEVHLSFKVSDTFEWNDMKTIISSLFVWKARIMPFKTRAIDTKWFA